MYDKEGKLLLKFRKNKLPKTNIDTFYDNVIKFAKNISKNRGNATGSRKRNLYNNPKVMSNIFGYFDTWTASHKKMFQRVGKTPDVTVRECRFNQVYPEMFKKTIPLIQDIDDLYRKLIPVNYKLQRSKADKTHFKIPNTSFTTITTNVNYQTAIHNDKGDDDDGFGNLAVIERGKYTGGETCFPQYGLGVNVRTGDILFMDVHRPHANLPIHKENDDAIRLSIVCYLRKNVWSNTKNKTRRFFDTHIRTMKNMKK